MMEAFSPLGDILTLQALLVGDDMRRYRRLQGKEKRETTLTENLIDSLSVIGRGLVRISEAPGPESHYGADLELWLRSEGYFTGLRLQAKSLHPRKKSDGVYDELHHGKKKGTRSQLFQLIRNTPEPLNPGYLYYNGLESQPAAKSACCSSDDWSRQAGNLGITVSSAESVVELVAAGYRKNLNDVLPQSVPLKCLAACERVHSSPLRRYPWTSAVVTWPLRLAGIENPWVVRDPERAPGPGVSHMMARFGPRIFDGPLPRHVEELLETDTVNAAPTAKFVVILDFGAGLG